MLFIDALEKREKHEKNTKIIILISETNIMKILAYFPLVTVL